MNTTIDWAQLQLQAKAASEQAYAPYSHFPVGVAILASSGRIYTGCNVENASYGGTTCAERNAIAAAVVVVIALLASPIFAIRSVTVEGNVYTSKEVLAAVTKTLKGASVFTVDTQRARELLLEDSWVSDVRITTRFPGKALVEIAERVPIIWYVGDDQKARIVDARGHVIAVLAGWPTKYLRVDGVGPSLEAGAVADDVYRAAAQLVLALPEELRPLVKSLEVSAGGELAMTLKGGTLVRFGPPNDLQDKLVAVVVLLRRQNPSTLAVIDVSTGDPTVQVR